MSKKTWKRLNKFIKETMKKTKVPGCVVGILHNDKKRTAGFGVTNINHPLPVNSETLFQIGSITKTFTATAIMRLVEMGKLDLDATVQTYIPNFKVVDEVATSNTTIRHLLTHVSGWVGDFFDDTGSGNDALACYVANMANLEQLAPLNTTWSYNNAGFCTAGYIIEKVTGKDYESVIHEFILNPLGLKNTYFNPTDVMLHRFVVGHHIKKTNTEVAQPWSLPRSAYPTGGIICNIYDLLQYASFQLSNGTVNNGNSTTTVLSPQSMLQMQSPQFKKRNNETIGLSWWINDTYKNHLISHKGGTMGQLSLLALIPDHKFAIAIFTNADSGDILIEKVKQWVLKEYLDFEIPRPIPIETTPLELATYVGRYCRPASEIELGIIANKLVAQITFKGGFPTKNSPPIPPSYPPMSLALCAKDRLLILDGRLKNLIIDVIRKSDGSIGWLSLSRRLHVRQT